jgi:hypothetical protein
VFRTDNNEECWKLTSVKNEVAEEDVSVDEPAGHSDSSDDQRYDYNIPLRCIVSKFNILESYLLRTPSLHAVKSWLMLMQQLSNFCQMNILCVLRCYYFTCI